MSVFKITLKNYRCFEDSQPLTLEVVSGFTALVGPNNSGKSTFLKSFHELRQLFGSLNAQTLYSLVHGGAVGANYAGVEDPLEIFHDNNSRPITIDLEFSPATPTTASLVRLTSTRASPNNWHGELWYKIHRVPRRPTNHPCMIRRPLVRPPTAAFDRSVRRESEDPRDYYRRS